MLRHFTRCVSLNRALLQRNVFQTSSFQLFTSTRTCNLTTDTQPSGEFCVDGRQIDSLTVAKLKEELGKRQLKKTGNKSVLLERLQEALSREYKSEQENSQAHTESVKSQVLDEAQVLDKAQVLDEAQVLEISNENSNLFVVDGQTLESLTVHELRVLLMRRRVKTSGVKAELIERLKKDIANKYIKSKTIAPQEADSSIIDEVLFIPKKQALLLLGYTKVTNQVISVLAVCKIAVTPNPSSSQTKVQIFGSEQSIQMKENSSGSFTERVNIAHELVNVVKGFYLRSLTTLELVAQCAMRFDEEYYHSSHLPLLFVGDTKESVMRGKTAVQTYLRILKLFKMGASTPSPGEIILDFEVSESDAEIVEKTFYVIKVLEIANQCRITFRNDDKQKCKIIGREKNAKQAKKHFEEWIQFNHLITHAESEPETE